MRAADIVSSVIGSIAVVLLGAIGRAMIGMRRDFRRFMQEHLWLLATTLWNRDNVRKIMTHLGMPIDNEPPADLPTR